MEDMTTIIGNDICVERLGVFDSRLSNSGEAEAKDRTVALYEIEYILDGKGIVYINGASYSLREGMVIIAKPEQIRRSKPHIRAYYAKISVSNRGIAQMLDSLPDVMCVTGKYDIRSIMESMIIASDSDKMHGAVLVYSKILELIYCLVKEGAVCDESIIDSNKKTVARMAEEFMQEHYDEKITLEDIAASVNLSPIYFHNLFLSATGTTVHKYLTDKRISIAHGLLLTSEMPISEIAYRCGFASQSYFNYVFKQKTGKTPGDVRRGMTDGYDI